MTLAVPRSALAFDDADPLQPLVERRVRKAERLGGLPDLAVFDEREQPGQILAQLVVVARPGELGDALRRPRVIQLGDPPLGRQLRAQHIEQHRHVLPSIGERRDHDGVETGAVLAQLAVRGVHVRCRNDHADVPVAVEQLRRRGVRERPALVQIDEHGPELRLGEQGREGSVTGAPVRQISKRVASPGRAFVDPLRELARHAALRADQQQVTAAHDVPERASTAVWAVRPITQNVQPPAATAGAGTGADSKQESTGAGQSPATGDHGGGSAQHGRRGTTTERGHSGAGAGAQATRGGTNAEGNAKGGAAAGHDGSTKGTDFGTNYDANYFYDPSKADVGSDDLAPEGGVKGGMVGGKPHSIDEGIPQGGWFELVAVPRDIAPAVAAGIILLDADIAGLGADIVKASVKLGRKAVGKGGALARVITKKLESYVERETAKLAQALSKDAAFASKTVSEQAAILAETRAAITHEANQRLAAQLEKEVAEHKAAAVVDSKRSDGWAEEFAKQEEDYARAAQGARDSLPDVPNPKSPAPTDASKVESPALEGNPYHPTAVDNRVRPPYEPNPAHDPHSPRYNPNKSVEPPDAEAVYAKAIRDDDISTWYGLGEQGWYQFFSNRAGTVHFAGLIEKADVPKPVRNAFGQK